MKSLTCKNYRLKKTDVFTATLVCCVLLAATAGSGSPAWAADPTSEPPRFIRIMSKASLIHLGSLDSFDITEGGTKAAELIFDYLFNKNRVSCRKAMEIYDHIIPNENFGGEYTALQWLCEFWLASKAEQDAMQADRVIAEWHKYLAQDNYTPLKTYLKQKYHLMEWKHKKTPKSEAGFRFLEDFMLFNNPRRERWEKTSLIMKSLPLKKGDVVADIGCGPGYYTFKFADIVGDTGHVFAVDTNEQHIEYVSRLARQFGLKNVEALKSDESGLKLSKKADVAYLCSLYHIIYTLNNDEHRDKFIGNIKSALKPGGTLVLIDNALVEDKKLPYHGPYIAKEMVINQLWYYGFRLVNTYQFIPQRYVLVFKLQPGPEPPSATLTEPLPPDCVPTLSKSPLIHALMTSHGPAFTESGRRAARIFREALEKKDPQTIRKALDTYKALIPKERFGDEYTAFQWFCEYLLAEPAEKEKMLSSWFVREYFDRLSADDFQLVKTYLRYKYHLDLVLDDEDAARTGKAKFKVTSLEDLEIPEASGLTQSQVNEWGDYIAFNNPNRESWEKTSKILDFLNIKPGSRVADVGCGPGYYTFKFSERVGPDGLVYALDTVQGMRDYVTKLCKKHGVNNVRLVACRENDTSLPSGSVDLIYLCSLYHALYLTSMEYVKDSFIQSVKRSLRKNGRLVVVDNSVLPVSQRYYGPDIAPELIIAQLKHYGFRLADRAQFIPQRYVLVFELER
ncbi:MAG: methyltransferase domain-containing protein [Planctomycetes bacterium]|nr:methyltransferase domain-containing protein [Planctomycetota bacterium]